jgi:hypothetical protein
MTDFKAKSLDQRRSPGIYSHKGIVGQQKKGQKSAFN